MPRARAAVRKAFVDFSNEVAKTIVLDATAFLIADTPKDTGWASVNWVPSVGAPFSGTAGTRAGAESGRLNRSPQSNGVARVLAYRIGQGNLFVVNNVPYIDDLNSGTSRQAPAAFVQSAIVRAVKAAERLKPPRGAIRTRARIR